MSRLVVLFAAFLQHTTCGASIADCVITDHGAVADNKTLNTAAIQGAIDACHAASPEGSRVLVPPGAFKTGSLSLRSNMELHLAKGAAFYGSTNPADYPIVAGLPFGTMWRALVSGYNLKCVNNRRKRRCARKRLYN